MPSRNKVLLMGNLGADPVIRYMPNGDAIANFRMATTERYKDRASGETKERTEWHRVVMQRGLAKLAEQFLQKGSCIDIEGKIRTRKWQDNEGKDRYTTEIHADEMQFISNTKPKQAGSAAPASAGSTPGGQKGGGDDLPPDFDEDNDIPFTTASFAADPVYGRFHRRHRRV